VSNGQKSHQIRCPICEKSVEFFADPLGPFCSSRCKMIDLGKWLGEEYRVSDPLRPDHFAGHDEIEGGGDLDRPV
jgi:hypothetical protein